MYDVSASGLANTRAHLNTSLGASSQRDDRAHLPDPVLPTLSRARATRKARASASALGPTEVGLYELASLDMSVATDAQPVIRGHRDARVEETTCAPGGGCRHTHRALTMPALPSMSDAVRQPRLPHACCGSTQACCGRNSAPLGLQRRVRSLFRAPLAGPGCMPGATQPIPKMLSFTRPTLGRPRCSPLRDAERCRHNAP